MSPSPSEAIFEGAGGISILYRSWRPATPPRAGVVLCHGVNSHGGQYFWTADQLVARGLSVFAIDLRGREKSGGPRFYVDDVSEYVGDLAKLITLAKSREPGLPVFLLGHSAGGVVACVYTLDRQAELAGLICESFAYRVPAPAFALAAIKGLSRIAPRLPVLKLKNKDFTREFSRITIPVLIVHGTADKATVPAGSQFFFDTAGSKDKTLKMYDGHVHDLFNDLGKDGVMADTVAWIERHL